MDIPTLIMGIIALVLGIGLIYWISRRKFYRRNGMGAEGFSSFEASVFIRLIERVGKWIAYALIIFGLLGVWASTKGDKNKEDYRRMQKIEQSSRK
ncbi:molybdenum ABC transporter permease [Chryseobacterium shandongense]|uniref:molybdenum ABC transporter permease n=1 Tax=Chryseobacterium shandongense TaxID=1493872 RepID=UPI000F51333E|nr:molybdenum ABC transporter permease [Chryseobacterium shandongense]AZA56482.1 molybdenum ABC transporter permease [Chryseobacterium shandongense]